MMVAEVVAERQKIAVQDGGSGNISVACGDGGIGGGGDGGCSDGIEE